MPSGQMVGLLAQIADHSLYSATCLANGGLNDQTIDLSDEIMRLAH